LNKKWMKTLLVWVILFGAIIFMVRGMDPTGKEPDELDYSADFLALVQNTEQPAEGDSKTIKAIRMTYRDVYGIYEGSDLELKDLEKNTATRADFHVTIPSEATFRADMAAIVFAANPGKYASVDEVSSLDYPFAYESAVIEESIWSILLPYLLIIGALGVFYYFMMRQQGGGKQMMNFGKSRARVQ